MPNFAENFKKLRLENGFSQKQLGSELNLSQKTISFYELGSRHPDFEGLIAIADYFDISLDELVGRNHR